MEKQPNEIMHRDGTRVTQGSFNALLARLDALEDFAKKRKSEEWSIVEWLKLQRLTAIEEYGKYKQRYGPCDNEMWRTEGIKAVIGQLIVEIEERAKGRK